MGEGAQFLYLNESVGGHFQAMRCPSAEGSSLEESTATFATNRHTTGARAGTGTVYHSAMPEFFQTIFVDSNEQNKVSYHLVDTHRVPDLHAAFCLHTISVCLCSNPVEHADCTNEAPQVLHFGKTDIQQS